MGGTILPVPPDIIYKINIHNLFVINILMKNHLLLVLITKIKNIKGI